MSTDLHPEESEKRKRSSEFSPYLLSDWPGNAFRSSFLLILIFLILIAIAWFYRDLFAQVSPGNTSDQSLQTEIDPEAQFIQHQGNLYYIDRPPGLETTDIFAQPITSTRPITSRNLTNSPDYSELHPVPAPNDMRLAFFAISQSGDRSMRLLNPGQGTIDLTYQTANSGLNGRCQLDFRTPPLWSPDGAWLAFLTICGTDVQAIELFVAHTTGVSVKPLSQSSQQVTQARWLDAQTLIYSEAHQDGSEAIYQVTVTDSQPQPTLLRNITAP